MAEELSGGDLLIRSLQEEGVEYIFGYPGGAALHIYDAIFRQQKISTFWCDMNRPPRIWQTDTLGRPVGQVSFL